MLSKPTPHTTLHCCSQPARVIAEIENTLKIQLIVSTVLMTPVAYIVATLALPDEFTLAVPGSDPLKPFDTKWVGGLMGVTDRGGRIGLGFRSVVE